MVLATAAGCGTGETTSDRSYPWVANRALTFFTWWRTDDSAACGGNERGEVCAGRTLTNGYAESTPGASAALIHHTRTDTLTSIEQVSRPSDGGIVNGGTDVVRLADCESPQSANIVQLGTFDAPIVDFLAARTPLTLRHLVTCPDNRLFGVILGLHSLNQLYFNRELFQDDPEVGRSLARYGVNFDGSLGIGDLPKLLDALAAADHVQPLVIERDAGTWSRFLIENVMVALAQSDPYGNDGYAKFWARLSSGTAEEDRSIDLNLFQETLDFVEGIAHHIRLASSPLQAIATRNGVLTVTGDWEVPNLPTQIGFRRFPGTEGVYVYTSDVAVATRRTNSLTIAVEDPVLGWLKSSTSGEVQRDYALQKNALSPETIKNGVTQAKSADELFVVNGVQLVGVPGLPSYVPYQTFDELEQEIQDHLECLITATRDYAPVTEPALAPDGNSRENPPAKLCVQSREKLLAYVHDQYCTVISGAVDGCVDVPQRHPARLH